MKTGDIGSENADISNVKDLRRGQPVHLYYSFAVV